MEDTEKQLAPIEKTSARHSLEAARKVRKLVKEFNNDAR